MLATTAIFGYMGRHFENRTSGHLTFSQHASSCSPPPKTYTKTPHTVLRTANVGLFPVTCAAIFKIVLPVTGTFRNRFHHTRRPLKPPSRHQIRSNRSIYRNYGGYTVLVAM